MPETSIISRSPLFIGIPEAELAQLFGQIHFQIRRYEKNEQIVSGGDICDRLLIIQRGSVKAEMSDYTGKSIKIEDIQALRPLASAFLFGRDNHFPVSVSANTTVELIVIPKQEFMKLMQLNSLILSNYLNAISTRTQFLSQKLKFLSLKTIRQKIAYFLLEKAGDRLHTIDILQSQESLAELFGVTRPSLARTLAEMNREGLIETERRSIRILDKQRMNLLLQQEKI